MSKIKCLVTAGPTREHFDPVRYISNPSSGKMGWNIAAAARDIGWEVVLILGPSQLPDIKGVETFRVTSAQDMLDACRAIFPVCDILIMSAAVSDVRPKTFLSQKAKKESIELCPQLERTPDILKTLSDEKKKQILVGFAAETQNVLDYAKKKLADKRLDAIVANSVAASDAGFAADSNKIDLILKGGEIVDFNFAPKDVLARRLVDFLSARYFG